MRQRRRFPVRSKPHSCTKLTVARQSCKPSAEPQVITTTTAANTNIDANASANDLTSVR